MLSHWLWAVCITKGPAGLGQWSRAPWWTPGGQFCPAPLTIPSGLLRWLSYLLLFVLDLVLCLLACLGLAKSSRCLLAS